MIDIIKDEDLYNHLNEYDAVLIGTNTYQVMSNGIQLQLMLNYPYVYEENLKTKYADRRKIGTLCECKKEGEPTICLCFIAKGYNFRSDLESDYLSYEGLENCLKLVNVLYKGKHLASYLLGSSEFDGNGDRERIMNIFKDNIKDLDLTIYDYKQKSRMDFVKETMTKEFEMKKKDRKKYYEMVKKRKEEAEERFRKNGHRRY